MRAEEEQPDHFTHKNLRHCFVRDPRGGVQLNGNVEDFQEIQNRNIQNTLLKGFFSAFLDNDSLRMHLQQGT